MTPDLSAIDWTPLMKSPLVGGVPWAVGIALLTWLLTEASSYFVAPKWRPAVALLLGPFFGWLTAAAEVLDFGAGPASWLRALLYGIVGLLWNREASRIGPLVLSGVGVEPARRDDERGSFALARQLPPRASVTQ